MIHVSLATMPIASTRLLTAAQRPATSVFTPTVGEPSRSSVPSDVDRRVGDLAFRQHGVVSRQQLDALGLSRSAIQSRIRRGWLRPVHRGVYAVGHSALSQRGHWFGACLAVGGAPSGSMPAAVLSGWSAAALLGLTPRDRGRPEVTVITARPTRRGIVIRRTGSLERSVTTRDQIPCTTVARTLIDIAGTGNEVAIRRLWSSAASQREIRRSDIEHELSKGRRGTALLRSLYDQDYQYLQQRTRSELEREALRMCRDFGLLMPLCNQLLWVSGTCFEPDMLWSTPRLIVELDGDGSHDNPAARRADRSRDLSLQLAGWRTVRIGWPEVTSFRAETAGRLRFLIAQPPLPPAPGIGEATWIEEQVPSSTDR